MLPARRLLGKYVSWKCNAPLGRRTTNGCLCRRKAFLRLDNCRRWENAIAFQSARSFESKSPRQCGCRAILYFIAAMKYDWTDWSLNYSTTLSNLRKHGPGSARGGRPKRDFHMTKADLTLVTECGQPLALLCPAMSSRLLEHGNATLPLFGPIHHTHGHLMYY